MKQLILIFLCGLLAWPACAQRKVKSPAALGCMNVTNGSLSAREVVFADTATTVHFTLDYPAGRDFRLSSACYLADESGRRYALRSAEGLTPNVWTVSPTDRTTHFTLHFEPLPKRTRWFDFIEYDGQSAFMLLGIHDKKQKLPMKTMEQLVKDYATTAPADWFRTDSVTLRGRIEGYTAEAGLPCQLELSYDGLFNKDDLIMVADIHPDGTFERRWEVDHPRQELLHWDKELPGMSHLEVFVSPGDTIDVTLRKGNDGLYHCDYHSGSSRVVERWLKSGLDFRGLVSRLFHCEGTPQEVEALADEVWQLMAYHLQTVAARHGFTPTEMQLALADAQAQYATGVMDYALQKVFSLKMDTAADSAVFATLRDTAFYSRLLSRVDFDNPLLMASSYYAILLNRLQFAWPVQGRWNVVEVTDEDGPWTDTPENILKEMENHYALWRGMMGCTKNSLMAQMCNYREMLGEYTLWRRNEVNKDSVLANRALSEEERTRRAAAVPCLSNVFPRYVASFSHEALRRHAAQYHARRQAQAALTSPLPEGRPAELIRSLLARYPGRFLVIDFWGMGCDPCRHAIQVSKERRAEIAKRNDVKLIYIASEETAEGSEAYHDYVKKWLDGEETICVTYNEFSRLQEYFRFNGIPHCETITPDGRLVGEEYRINGLYNLENDLRCLLKALR